MAISIGEQVALYVPVANSVPEKRSGNFVFGVAVVDGGTMITVQWENGAQSQVEEAYLDKIIPAVGTSLVGKVMQITDWNSAFYRVLVLMTYSRQLTGTGTQTPFALCVLVGAPNVRLEVPVGLLTAVVGQ